MDIQVFTQLLSSVGFPIACVVAMFYYWNKEREAHKEEMEKMTEALNNNTLALTKLEGLLSHDKD